MAYKKENLDNRLKDANLRVVPTRGEGDCLFHALRMMLHLEDNVLTIRNKIVDKIRALLDANVQIQESSLTEKLDPVPLKEWLSSDWGTYLLKMAKSGTYADDPCIWAASSLYNVKIIVYVSSGMNRVFDLSDGTQEISIGNYDQHHFVATETYSDDDSYDDVVNDLNDWILGEEVGIISLMDMYNQTFKNDRSPDSALDDFRWDKDILVRALVSSCKVVYNKLCTMLRKTLDRKLKSKDKQAIKTPLADYLNSLKNNDITVVGKLQLLIKKDYQMSRLSAEQYKNVTNYNTWAEQLLLSWFSEASPKKVTVDVEKKGRLLRIIHMAIKIGLNYQMLSPFRGQFLPDQHDEKVRMSDLAESPYWEGIHVVPDMDGYVPVASLRDLKTDQLVNMVKRVTLYKIYKVNKDYRLNLDEASPTELKTLCSLKTLERAPGVHADACRYFVRGTGSMDTMYETWLQSNKSFKPYRKEVTDETKFITVPETIYPLQTTVNDVLGDVHLLAGLIKYRNHDDHEKEIVKHGDIDLANAPSDAGFAVELSQKFVELGFLPEGYEMYCGVKFGEVRAKRSSVGMSSSAKRQRRKLFTPVKSY